MIACQIAASVAYDIGLTQPWPYHGQWSKLKTGKIDQTWGPCREV